MLDIHGQLSFSCFADTESVQRTPEGTPERIHSRLKEQGSGDVVSVCFA